jgi:hypothetical protein
MDWLTGILSGVVGPILGGVAGGLIGFLAQSFWRIWDWRQKRKNVRTLVRRELDRNIDLLHDYWKRVAESRDAWTDDRGDPLTFRLGVAAAETTFPDLDLEAWTQNLNEIPDFYSGPELKRIWEEVERIRQIRQRHSHLQNLVGSYYATKKNKADIEAQMDPVIKYGRGGAPGQYQANLNRLSSTIEDEMLKLKKEIEGVLDNGKAMLSLPERKSE